MSKFASYFMHGCALYYVIVGILAVAVLISGEIENPLMVVCGIGMTIIFVTIWLIWVISNRRQSPSRYFRNRDG